MYTMEKEKASRLIKDKALEIGFAACGMAEIATASSEIPYFDRWIANGGHAGMKYMENYRTLRFDPSGLVEGACSVISIALNYYPSVLQPAGNPQIAYYAYGEDYHVVMKRRMNLLLDFIREKVLPLYPGRDLQARCFVDSAPVLERYWAWKAGLGWIGRNTTLILPGKGSYFFLGEIVCNLPFAYDTPLKESRCGTCTRCIDNCPTGALECCGYLNANKCLSYLTIENKGEIPEKESSRLGNRIYGCDTCQQVCPWNRFASPTGVEEFHPGEDLLALDHEQFKSLTREDYTRIFARSAVKRGKYEGLIRTGRYLK